MPKASPMVRSFNAGEFSPLVEARTDLDRQASSLRQMTNTVAAQQGPAIPRSGTFFLGEAYTHDTASELVPFVFNEAQAQVIEFADQKIRIYDEAGLLIYAPVSCTITSTSPFEFTSATLNGNVGGHVVFMGFDDEYNLNAAVYEITAKSGSDYTVDAPWPGVLAIPSGIEAALVFELDSPYAADELDMLRPLQSLDVIYLPNIHLKPYKLKRNNTYDWEFEAVDFFDGPYMDIIKSNVNVTISSTGKATSKHTSATSGSGTASGTGGTPWQAFDEDDDSYWQSSSNQTGNLQYDFGGSGKVVDGYTIHMAYENSNASFTNDDYAPATWFFEGSTNGSTWVVLDKQYDYVAYENGKSNFFEIKNDVSYRYYRINIKKVDRNGTVTPRIREFVMRSASTSSINLTFSGTTGINGNQGFLSTDVGRLIRLKGTDNSWRTVKITAVNSTTSLSTTLISEPFLNTDIIREFRLGYWSETTGWPNYAVFYQDRLWWGGSDVAPDLIVGSVVGDYENMQQATTAGEVLDTNAIVVKLNSRKLSRIKWLEASNKGLLCGTGSQEFVLSSVEGSGKTITPETVRAIEATERGSSDTAPVTIDGQVIYTQRSGRTVREYAYVFEAENFKSPSMNLLANHLGVKPFTKMAYAAEPYSIIWMLRANGTMVGLTYNRDENVVGWHTHDFQNEVIESIAVIPAQDKLQDVLFMCIKRTVDGAEKRYIERLTRFWDFDMELEDAHYVDSAVKYSGAATRSVYGLQHLEGRTVYGLADNIPVGPIVIANGKAELEHEAEEVLLGLGYESICEISRLEAGAGDGTAQGKEKRINNVTLLLWRSYGGEIGTYDEDTKKVEWVPLEYPEDLSQISDIVLFDGTIGPSIPPLGYNKRGTLFFRKPINSPLPFNVVGIMPQITTQDR